jgi:phage recombination protein Bet
MNGTNYPQPVPPFLNEQEVELLKRTMLGKFPDDEKETFIRVCQRTKLDPFTKQIYPTKRYQKVKDEQGNTRKVPTLVTVTGIMGLCGIAERTGNYDGCEIRWSGEDGVWREEWLSQEPPAAARCIVFHKHRTHPEVGIARWTSYVGLQWNSETQRWETTDFWERMPDYMLAKCAKAQALRGAFPDQLSNIYIREELDSHLTDSEADLDLEEAATRTRLEEASKVAAQVPPKPPEPTEPTAPPPVIKKTPPVEPVVKGAPPVVMPPPVQGPAGGPGPQPQRESSPPSQQQDTTEKIMGPGGGQDGEGFNVGTPEESAPAWKTYRIKGLRHAKFFGRLLGELTTPELKILEEQWIPAVREKWETDASDAQKEDVKAMESAIAFHKMERPW